jgi:cbb3-type cytochrome oxidase subunit 3
MDLTYDTVARFCMVASLLLFVAMFIAMLAYVFFFASKERLERAQKSALDLGQDHSNKNAGRA